MYDLYETRLCGYLTTGLEDENLAPVRFWK